MRWDRRNSRTRDMGRGKNHVRAGIAVKEEATVGLFFPASFRSVPGNGRALLFGQPPSPCLTPLEPSQPP